LLEEPSALGVASHLADCHACRSELTDLARFMAGLRQPLADAAGDLFDSLRTIRGRLAFEPLAGSPGQMAPAVRGPEDGEAPRVYTAEDVLVTVDSWVERLGQPGRIVAGLVVGPVDLTNAEATIDTSGMSNTSPINELGNFLFTDVTPGVYHLVIRLPATGVQIEVDDLTVD
jgi:hypothetical protein